MTHRIAVLLALAALAGCKSSIIETKKIDYKSATQAAQPLEIPPDLPAPATNDRYAVPDSGRSSATYSEYAEGRPAHSQGQGQGQGILPERAGARIERAGTQRWLVVEQPAENVWPVLREFWQEQGFIVALDQPEIGVMETDWAENRAKIPPSFVRSMLGKVFDQAYSTPERDKFRTRVERGAKEKATEVYISHRGAYEMYVADANIRQTGRTVWQPRPADPDLEAEMLSRLMVKFGTPPELVTTQVKGPPAAPRATLAKSAAGVPELALKDDFERGWRRVGLSLDRLGFAVQDRDRAAGVYYVRYLNPTPGEERSLLSRLAFWQSDAPANKAEEYRIAVAEAGGATKVTVLDSDGKPDASEAAARILTVLEEDLK